MITSPLHKSMEGSAKIERCEGFSADSFHKVHCDAASVAALGVSDEESDHKWPLSDASHWIPFSRRAQ
jgi:hypothetical protein